MKSRREDTKARHYRTLRRKIHCQFFFTAMSGRCTLLTASKRFLAALTGAQEDLLEGEIRDELE
jgi:hypothetical protein